MVLVAVMNCPVSADTIWTIGSFNDGRSEFDNDPHGEPEEINYTIGDPISQFPSGLGTDIGPERSVVNIHFEGMLDFPSLFTIRWSPGEFAPEQFQIGFDGIFIANSVLRYGEIPAVWTTDTFILPAVPGTEHVLTLVHLLSVEYGHGTWHDALRLEAVPEPTTTVPFDIKPGSCPNMINTKSRGVLPVAIQGGDIDVADIDISSVRLEGISPIRSAMEDVATPFMGDIIGQSTDCWDLGADGFMDLTLKFDTQKIVGALSDVQDGEVRVLTLTGVLNDGTPIKGGDLVIIKKKNYQ